MTIDETLAALTLTEKVALLTGADYWHTKAFPDAGVGKHVAGRAAFRPR